MERRTMRWVIISEIDGKTIYGKIDDDGLMRTTCIAEHQELKDWITAGNEPEVWTEE